MGPPQNKLTTTTCLQIFPLGMTKLGVKVEQYQWWYCWYKDLRLQALLGSVTAIKAYSPLHNSVNTLFFMCDVTIT
jgi:hypothetical protein